MNRKHSLFVTIVSLLVALSLPAWAGKAPEIPAGTTVKVRIIDKLSSEESRVGDVFHGTLEEPIQASGKDLYPRGADVSGRVSDVHPSGRLSEPGELDLVLTTVSSGKITTSLRVQPLVIKGESHAKSNATKIGGGAVLGTIIGAVAGGGKGAAIGAGAGAAAGTGAAAATGKRAAVVESEAVLTFVTSTASGSPGESTANQSAPATEPADSTPLFTLRDRRIIRTCVSEHTSDFQPGTTERPALPSGSERQIARGETLSADVQKKVQSLPLACVQQLPRLPNDMERVVYNGRVLLIDSKNNILDTFYLDENQ
jgi:hypothetical protein